jgi:cation diffusion facilitator CzcD-associated flavoprotein CzcO
MGALPARKDHLDVLVIGGGFAGVFHLYKLRKLGFSVHLFDAGKSCTVSMPVDVDTC